MNALRHLPFGLVGLLAWATASWSQDPTYRHWFRWKQSPDEATLARCLEEMRLIVADQHNVVRDVTPRGPLQHLRLVFNRAAGDANPDENFTFPGSLDGVGSKRTEAERQFCRAANPAHNAVLTACLIIARDHFRADELEIGSAGTWLDAWQGGAVLYVRVLDRMPANPMTRAGGDAPRTPVRPVLKLTETKPEPSSATPVPATTPIPPAKATDSEQALDLLLKLGLAGLGILVAGVWAWSAIRDDGDHVLSVGPDGVSITGRTPIPEAVRGEVVRFLQDIHRGRESFRIVVTRGGAGRGLGLRFRGKISVDDQQRVRNFLSSRLR